MRFLRIAGPCPPLALASWLVLTTGLYLMPALVFAQAPPLSPSQLGDRAAVEIRAARQADTISERNRRVDQALTLLDRVVDHPDANRDALRRSRFDRVVALRVREAMDEAVAAYEALLEDGLQPPDYVTTAAADAYLYNREPERAAELYDAIMAGQPDRYATRQSLFWARLEQEDFEGAFDAIDGLVAHPRIGAGSATHRDARITAAMGRGYANRLDDAMHRLESIFADHPDNAAARRSLATIYRWRGWSRRALALIEPLLEAGVEDTDTQLLHAALLRDLGDYEQAGALIERLHERHPEDRHVQRDVAGWQRRDRWAISAHAEYGESDGVQAFGSRGRSLTTRLSAPWVGNYTQPYFSTEYSDATFPEGQARYDRIAVGLDYRRAGHDLNLELHRNRRDGDDTGFSLGYDYRLDDHWTVATRYESFSTDVPLRARGQGLDGWKAEAAVSWRAHESLGLRLGLSRLAISDGNERDAALATLTHRLRVSAHHTTDGRLDLYAARASQTGGPYYNPERDASLTYQVKHDWLTWREYEHSFTQRFLIAGGGYWQEGFGTHGIGLARYEHLWQLSETWFLHYGIGVSSRVYDGNRESRVDGQLWFRGVF